MKLSIFTALFFAFSIFNLANAEEKILMEEKDTYGGKGI